MGENKKPDEDEETGLLVAVFLSLALGLAYAYVIRDNGKPETWGSLVIAGIVGFAAGHFGGKGETVPLAVAVAAPLATYLGLLLGIALLLVHPWNGDFSDAWKVFTDDFGQLAKAFKSEAEPKDWIMLLAGAPVGYFCARGAVD
ncbi:hypothetical protein [Streptomyces cucumeris]|uniref:hypothetical protein n=1 Tax=Streptomyces cucumeris TaxID=2962890 RepID=UPI003D7058E1